MDFTFGTKVDASNNNAVSFLDADDLGIDKFISVFADASDGNKGKATVCTVSGTVVTAGTPSTFANKDIVAASSRVGVAMLDTDKAMAFFIDDGSGDNPTVIASTVSGTTPTWGSEVVVASVAASRIRAKQLDTDKSVVYYSDNTNNQGRCAVISATGTVLTIGTPSQIGGSQGTVNEGDIAILSSTKFVVFYEDASSNDAKACVGTVSGTTISWGSVQTIETGTTDRFAATGLDGSTFLGVYRDGTNLVGNSCTVSGTVITIGTKTTIASTGSSVRVGDDKIDSTHAVVSYLNTASGDGEVRLITVSGISFTVGDANVFDSGSTDRNAVALIDTDKIAIFYDDNTNGDGSAIVGDVNLPSSTIQGVSTIQGISSITF